MSQMERSNYNEVAPRVYLSGYGTIQPMNNTAPELHGGSAAFYWVNSDKIASITELCV